MVMLAAHFYNDSWEATTKLWNMLPLLPCSDRTELVDTSVPPPDDVHRTFEALRGLGSGVEPGDMDQFRVMVAEYAFRLS